MALFVIPFSINYEKLIPNVGSNPNLTVTINNGIHRSISSQSDNDEDYLKFPIILACFTNSDKIKIGPEWVTCYDNNDIHIVGHFDIKIKKDRKYEEYIEYRKNNNQTKKYSTMLELEYIINFNKNIKFEEENTIPIAIKNSIYSGGKTPNKTRKLKKSYRFRKLK